MRERLAQLVGTRSRGMWVSTFHSMCVRMLRADAERLGFTKNFTIYDTDDLKRLYKDIMAELNIDPKRFPVNQLMNRISQAKNDLVTPGNFDAHDPVGKVAERVYERLQERLRAANAFDFDDLLLYGYLLLKNHEDVREAYQDRFRYLMVVPGHQPRPVRHHPAARRQEPQHHGGGRRRPVHLLLARRRLA